MTAYSFTQIHCGHPPDSGSPSLESVTIGQALEWGIRFLLPSGIPDPRLSAEILLGSVTGLNRVGLLLKRDQAVEPVQWDCYKEWIKKRAEHFPVAYLTGEKEFWSLSFSVHPGVLIPRPESELLVETALKIPWSTDRVKQLVELGTGSGAVIVSLCHSSSGAGDWRFLATDISWAALETARHNAEKNGIGQRIEWVLGDWLTPFSHRSRWIDLLVVNPPYIADTEYPELPRTVRAYEPASALRGGPDGLDAVRSIIHQAASHLKIGGWLLMEFGQGQGSRIQNLVEDLRFHPSLLIKDYAGQDRVLKACYHG